MAIDYGLYLVTDPSDTLLRGRDLIDVVQEAIRGGVSIVQYRDKASDTKTLVATARRLHAITRQHGIPLIVNDRVDVALAVGTEGVHVGQDDMDLETTRRLLGPDAIIGVTCHNIDEAHAAAYGGADYLGIGTVFATQTKPDASDIIGTAGCREILDYLSTSANAPDVSIVAIGGINGSNIQRVLYQSEVPRRSLHGVAVVSAIIGADHPRKAASDLRALLSKSPPFQSCGRLAIEHQDTKGLLRMVFSSTRALVETAPLCHNMTNQVVQNIAANVVLAIGAKPIMSHDGGEAEDLSSLGGGLVINMGTANVDTIGNFLRAMAAYNKNGAPVLLDPVGAGATRMRRQAVKQLLAGGYFDFIKGNESEIQVVWGTTHSQQRGVDSSNDLSQAEKVQLVKKLATRERNIVIMTGEVDFVSDGARTYRVENGHPLLGMVTGTGCTLGATIASYAAALKNDKLVASIAALLHFEIAAERAARSAEVKGPGSFVPAFIDNLREIARLAKDHDNSWLSGAKVIAVD